MVRNLRLPVLLLLVIVPVLLQAQIRIASPYSRFGLGSLSGNLDPWTFSMGNTSIAMRSRYHILYENPASYTAFDSLSFIFEGAFQSEFVTLKSSTESTSRNYASLGCLLFGMPVTKWWRTVVGLVPYSDVGYNLVSSHDYSGTGQVTLLYTGEGGINKFFWGNGFRPFRDFSIGINSSYLFGSMDRRATEIFVDSVHSNDLKVDNYITFNDIYFDFGVQYHRKLKEDLTLTIGGVFGTTTKIAAKTDLLAQTFILGSSGTEIIKDTIAMKDGISGNVLIPKYIGGGISMERTDNWILGADFTYQNWKNFRAFGLSDSLVDSYKISVGAEIIPNINNYANYLKRIRYRLGFMYNSGYLELRGRRLNEYCVSAGFGLPLRGKTSIDISIQYGTHGTTEQNLIKESYLKFVIGFSIYERWFVKRKYF
jgi:hypothetical protein